MKKILFSSLVAIAMLSGCGGDSACCDNGPVELAAGVPPIAKITGIENVTALSLGQSITVNGIASSDRDGNVVAYKWKLNGKDAGDTQSKTFTFNEPGSYEICLTVTDNDGQDSVNMECKTINILGTNSITPVLPTAVIDLSNENDLSDYSKHHFSCANSHDNDTLGIGDEIVNCEWKIQSYAIDANGNEVPYRDCSDMADGKNGADVYICPKSSKIIVQLTVTDNDGQKNSTTKTYTRTK